MHHTTHTYVPQMIGLRSMSTGCDSIPSAVPDQCTRARGHLVPARAPPDSWTSSSEQTSRKAAGGALGAPNKLRLKLIGTGAENLDRGWQGAWDEHLQLAQLLSDAVARLSDDARLNVQGCQELLQSPSDRLTRKMEREHCLSGQSWPTSEGSLREV